MFNYFIVDIYMFCLFKVISNCMGNKDILFMDKVKLVILLYLER